MVWFQCEDCGENLKKPKLKKHFSMCSATKLSCIDCGNMFGRDSVQWHNQCLTEAEKYGPKRPSSGTPSNPKENSKQQINFDINVALSNRPSWICSLCNAKTNSKKDFFAHVHGWKHREKAKGFDAKQRKQFEQPTKYKDNSYQLPDFDITVGLSKRYPWFCSLCNTNATSQQDLLVHADGKKHRAKAKGFHAKQQQSEQSTMDEKDTDENASNGDGDSEQKKVDLRVSSGVANGYHSQVDKKRKLETFDGNKEVVQAEEAEEGGEKNSRSKKAKKQDHEKKGKKKQTDLDSDFEYDKEDMKLLLVSYSKEELIYLIYKTAEKGSRLMSAILESAERDISERNIFVRGFGWDTTQEYLKAAFESYGEIEECSVIMDKDTGRSKGYGFVLFKTRKGTREALKNPEKRIYNRIVVCNLASAKPCGDGKMNDMVEPVKFALTQIPNPSDVALPGIELAQRHRFEQRQQQPTMEMFGHNMPFFGHSQPPGFDPMYGASLRGNQMVAGLPNYGMFGSGLMNQESVAPSNHVGMARQYFGDPERTYWYQR